MIRMSALGRCRIPADVRRAQRLSLRLRSILRKRLCADGARFGRTPADRRLSEPQRTIPVVYFRRAYHYICCMMNDVTLVDPPWSGCAQ